MHRCSCEGRWLMLGVFLSHFLAYILRQSLIKFRACWFGSPRSQARSKDSPSSFPRVGVIGRPHTYLALHCIGHLHSGLHICLTHALPTEFSPRLLISIVIQHWGAYLLHWSPLWVYTLFYLQWNLHVDKPVKKNQYQNFIGHQLCDLPLHFTNMLLTCL